VREARRKATGLWVYTHWWRLDEVYVKIDGERRYLWRVVSHEGEVLDSYAAKTRDKAAVLAFIKKALNAMARPRRSAPMVCAPTRRL
jgi:putative transposase